MVEPREIVFKVLILGDSGVGKTSLFHRFTNGNFTEAYKSTIGVDFSTKKITWDLKTNITINLWDMAGQERFYEACKSHFRQTDGIFCVMDMANPTTSEKCHQWRERAINLSTNFKNEQNHPPIICLGNKYDLFDRERFKLDLTPLEDGGMINPIAEEKAGFTSWCQTTGYADGFLVSAKTKEGIDESMRTLIELMLENYYKDEDEQRLEADSQVFKLGSEEDKQLQQSALSYYYSNSCGRC